MEFSHVLSPIRIGTMEVRNRFVVPPMGTNFADEDGFVTQQLIDYYTERAKGGFGLIILEVTAIHPGGRSIPNEVGVWRDEHIEGLKKLTDSVHQYGAKIALQLHHAGRQTEEAITRAYPVGPSAVSCPATKIVPKELTNQEVYDLIEDFGDGALRAVKAGFDAVEIHGAHGYLIGQFMSAHSNKRMDEFGGDIYGRMRFPVEIMRNIRGKVGSGFPVLFRYSARELVQDGVDINQAKIIARIMEKEGVNAIHASLCTYGSLEWMSVPGAVPAGFNAFAAEEVKKAVKIPVITVGKINDPYLAESIIETKEADLVALGRESIADPHFPNKVASGRIDEICPCIACEQSCHGYLTDPGKLKICCLANPFVGKEGTSIVKKASSPKKVMVVGGGPAGLMAAWVTAKAGHDVTLYDKNEILGGQFRLAAIPPAKQDIIRLLKYYIKMCDKYGVKIQLGTEVNEALIKEAEPDAVILATGSVPLMLNIEGMNAADNILASEILDGKKVAGQKVLIAGGGMVGAETAEFLVERGHEVTIVDLLPEIAQDVQGFVKTFLMKNLKCHDTRFITKAKIKKFLSDGIVYESEGKDITLTGFDSIVLAMGAKAYNPLEEKVRGMVKECYVIGDAVRAGQANKATEEALAAALQI